MNILVLGKGKTGSIVADIARERGHNLVAFDEHDTADVSALSAQNLHKLGIEVAIDFTAPDAVIENIIACAAAEVNLVVGTTGWYGNLAKVRELVEQSGIGFVYGSNFSVGVNVFFDIVRAAASAVPFGYDVKIVERHHEQKKDQPSGTAVTINKVLRETSEADAEITSIREGDVIGTHTVFLDSEFDTMMLVHDAKSRRGFANGAVQAAEWIKDKTGFYEFKDVFSEMKS
jgi:4-hydroxy-tetrahydrodipicolinate reductase